VLSERVLEDGDSLLDVELDPRHLAQLESREGLGPEHFVSESGKHLETASGGAIDYRAGRP
jgi:hypothetical protein